MQGELSERDFFEEKAVQKVHPLTCPHCDVAGEYAVNWLLRRKRRECPRGASERDRARFAKAQSYMTRRDDVLACSNPRCRKRFEIATLQSVAIVQEVAEGSPEERAARIRAMFGRKQ